MYKINSKNCSGVWNANRNNTADEIMDSACPNCQWQPPNDYMKDRYIIKGNKCIIVNEEIIEQIKEKIYPEIKNEFAKSNMYLNDEWFWDEIHLCPNCNKEFGFRNDYL